ncbi:hypothetical protein Ddc_09010 [Ditylenchus destructor]|nr:hypothetical protein Ddc_09010 [Ditylenchus destructor]
MWYVIVTGVLLMLTVELACTQQTFQRPIRVTPRPYKASFTSQSKHMANQIENYNKPAGGYSFMESTIHEDEVETETEAPKPLYGMCLFKYIPSSCKESNHCGTKKLCVTLGGNPCCAAPVGECPSPIQLDINCVKSNPINWCHHHNDCVRKALCCDTGCGYNMCVEQQGL